MRNIEQTIKNQYSKVFKKDDWAMFKLIADYYLAKAATLKRKDIDFDDTFTLLIRNIQKRLFLGIAAEFLVKACYLKNGYVINQPRVPNNQTTIRFTQIRIPDLKPENTFTLTRLRDHVRTVANFTDWAKVEKGFKILTVFRNKEGHVVSISHNYRAKDYRTIEEAIVLFYQDIFQENINFHISMEDDEIGEFKILD